MNKQLNFLEATGLMFACFTTLVLLFLTTNFHSVISFILILVAVFIPAIFYLYWIIKYFFEEDYDGFLLPLINCFRKCFGIKYEDKEEKVDKEDKEKEDGLISNEEDNELNEKDG